MEKYPNFKEFLLAQDPQLQDQEAEDQENQLQDQVTQESPIDPVQTLKAWQYKCNQLVFIYNSVLENYVSRNKRILVLALIFGTLATLVGSVNTAVTESSYSGISFGFKIASVSLTAIATILTGTLTVTGWKTTIADCQKYLNLVQAFESQIVTELDLPSEFQTDLGKFLASRKSQYSTILQTAPDIPHSDYLKALDQFLTFRKKYSDLNLVV